MTAVQDVENAIGEHHRLRQSRHPRLDVAVRAELVEQRSQNAS